MFSFSHEVSEAFEIWAISRGAFPVGDEQILRNDAEGWETIVAPGAEPPTAILCVVGKDEWLAVRLSPDRSVKEHMDFALAKLKRTYGLG